MTNEQIEELKHIRRELDIPKGDFLTISGLSLNYKEYEKPAMTDEDVFELIKEAMMCYDNKPLTGNSEPAKSVEQAFRLAANKLSFEPVYMGTTDEMDVNFPSL